MTSMTETTIPGYVAGTWTVDPVHSDVSFTVRHMMVSKVRGHFRTFSGTLVTNEDIDQSSVTASIDLASFSTNNAQRDAHIRSKDFFEVETYPTMTFRSAGIRADGEAHVIDGELTLHGVTKSVPLAVEISEFGIDIKMRWTVAASWSATRSTYISRSKPFWTSHRPDHRSATRPSESRNPCV